MTRWRRRGGRSCCWGTWPGPRRARGPPPGPCPVPGVPRGPTAPTTWWWCTAAGPLSAAPAAAASRYGPGYPVPTGARHPRWGRGDRGAEGCPAQSQPAVTAPSPHGSPASPWVAPQSAGEERGAGTAPKGLVPCHPYKQVSSHQLRGHPCFFHQINGVAPFAGCCHINLCSCVILKALQSIFYKFKEGKKAACVLQCLKETWGKNVQENNNRCELRSGVKLP